MKLKKLNQKGITHLLPIMAVLVILIIGFAAYRVMDENSDQQQISNEQAPVVETKEKTEAEKAIYNFENSSLQVDLPEGWKVNIDKRFDQTGDSVKESYHGTIDGPDEWSIAFALDQGGFGGGPGCNFNNEFPDMPECPHYEVVSKQELKTGDYLYHYSQSKPGNARTGGSEEELGLTNCVIVSEEGESKDKKVGDTFEATGWICHSYIELKGATVENGKPFEARLSIQFPRGLDKNTSTAYRQEDGFKQAMEILGSLNYR